MGELPPLHTPQGPGVPRASRPGFPRVDSSGTSSAPSSRSASFPFLASGSPHFAPRVSLRFLPVPSPSLRPVPVGLSTSFLTPLPGSFSSPFHAYLLGIVLCLGLCFPPEGFGYVFLSFLLRFLQFPSPSFPFLSSSSPQFSPLSSSSVLPSSSRPHGVPTLSPFSFRIPGSAAALSRLGFCGPQVAPKRPHTTPEKRQS